MKIKVLYRVIWESLVVFIVLGPGSMAPGQYDFQEIKKITASDGSAGAEFGSGTSIDGDTLVVGAAHTGFEPGSAYVFERNHGGAENWGEVTKLLPSGTEDADRFGWSVAISGDIIVVGSIYDRTASLRTGAVYIFERNYGGENNWGEVTKLVASDGAESDLFGYSVSIDGQIVAVGAPGVDTAGEFSGSVYIYERNHNGTGRWGEVKKLIGSDTTNGSTFGFAVSLNGDIVAIGAPDEFGFGVRSGAAYVFERNEGGTDNWGEVRKLIDSDAQSPNGREFGASISIHQNTVLVGDTIGDHTVYENAGSAFIYERDHGGTNNWGQMAEVISWELPNGLGLGYKCAILGDLILARGESLDNTSSLYAFKRDQGGVNEWEGVGKLTASDADEFDIFGWSLGIGGNTVVVGSKRDDDNGENSGSVYIFEDITTANVIADFDVHTGESPLTLQFTDTSTAINTTITSWAWDFDHDGTTDSTLPDPSFTFTDPGPYTVVLTVSDGTISDSEIKTGFIPQPSPSWMEVEELMASDTTISDYFGQSVAIANNTIVVGARGIGGGSGAAYVYERNPGSQSSWVETRRLVGSDTNDYDKFGYSVAISGDTIVVGALEAGDTSHLGAVYIFERHEGGINNWGEVQRLTGPSQGAFGFSVATFGTTIVVGAPADNDLLYRSGAAYVFERGVSGTWEMVRKLKASELVGFDYFGSAVAGWGDTIVIGAYQHETTGLPGAAYIYQRNSGGLGHWGQVQKLVAEDGAANDSFGNSVSIYQDTLVIGARWHEDDGYDTGKAYVFERDTDEYWRETSQLTGSDPRNQDEFGTSVFIWENLIGIGAYRDNDPRGADMGSAYLFQRDAGDATWQEIAKFAPSSGMAGDHFGASVAIFETTMIVGNRLGHRLATKGGSVYVYESGDSDPIPQIDANFTSSPRPVGRHTVQFNDISLAQGTEIVAWAWDFDSDGIVDSHEQHPSFTFRGSGSYSVRLTVSDGTRSDETSESIDIEDPCEACDNGDPAVAFDWEGNRYLPDQFSETPFQEILLYAVDPDIASIVICRDGQERPGFIEGTHDIDLVACGAVGLSGLDFQAARNVRVLGLTFGGEGVNLGYDVEPYRTDSIMFRDCLFQNALIGLHVASGNANVNVEHCRFQNNYNGLVFSSGGPYRVFHNEIGFSGYWGLVAAPDAEITIERNTIHDSAYFGIVREWASGGGQPESITVLSNNFHGNGGYVIPGSHDENIGHYDQVIDCTDQQEEYTPTSNCSSPGP